MEQTCKQSFDCYGGCYGYWSDYYGGQFSSYKACTDECVNRYYCQGWSPYGGEPCYTYGPDTYGEKNCDKCQIVGYQCDATYGKIPVYGDPNAPLPSGLMTPADVCYQTYTCNSNTGCSYQNWATTGDDQTACENNCQTVGYQCNSEQGKLPVYGNPNGPPPDGIMSPSETCYQTYTCNSNTGCSYQNWATTGNDQTACENTCTPYYTCTNEGCKQQYSSAGIPQGGHATLQECTSSCDVIPGTLSGQCPGGEFPCYFVLSIDQNTATISCQAYGVSLSWDGSAWTVTSAPCGPHDVISSAFDPVAKTMSAYMYDNGCTCNWQVTVP